MNLDAKWELWSKKQDEAGRQQEEVAFGLDSANPLLANIQDYLIEEVSAEEDELLGNKLAFDDDGHPSDEKEFVSRDEELIHVLDRLLLYLRIVHSVDFYNHSEYPNEDEMPNRCGIIHARGPASTDKVFAV